MSGFNNRSVRFECPGFCIRGVRFECADTADTQTNSRRLKFRTFVVPTNVGAHFTACARFPIPTSHKWMVLLLLLSSSQSLLSLLFLSLSLMMPSLLRFGHD